MQRLTLPDRWRGKARSPGVTALTSQSDEMAQAVYGQQKKQAIGRVAARAPCGLDGIICYPADLEIAARVDAGGTARDGLRADIAGTGRGAAITHGKQASREALPGHGGDNCEAAA